MLKDINGKNVVVLPKSRKKFFENGLSKITRDEYDQMEDYINQLIDDNCKSPDGSTLSVPGWNAPGSWKGKPLQIIWDKIFPGDNEHCAFWYGLLYMQIIIDRDDEWFATKSNFDREFDQMIYFKSNN